jgi:hypothetical protein
MSFNPNEPRDKDGKWTDAAGSTSGGPTARAQRAVEWIKSGEAQAAIAKLASPERVKAAATFAVQGALFKLGGINDPMVDVAIKHQVQSLANDLQVTTAHARQVMLGVVRSLIKARNGEG